MNVEIKKGLIIFHDHWDWESISEKIIEEYGPSTMISWKLKRELGFTVRHHKGLVAYDSDNKIEDLKGRYYYSPQIHLDFYDEVAQSFFALKYIG
jgi:hypothetical protein